MFFIIPLALGMLIAGLHSFLRRNTLDKAGVLDLFLRYLLVFGWFLSGLVGFMGHAFAPEKVAAGIGWPTHVAFQFELAAFELGIALTALIGLWVRHRLFWLGMALAPSVFFVLAAIQHLRELMIRGNVSSYNVLAVLPDLLLPGLFLALLFWLMRLERKVGDRR
ncbi:MAG: hypothetical protein Q8O00_00950 [Holophaga sp.]|nr:hypothetical protein [Holophaga sp.]